MKIGIIGGSGLDDPSLLEDFEEVNIETPFGNPSSAISSGKISGVDVAILSRHGKRHEITPTNVNNRANIYALKEIGCTHIIATTAVGSLREKIGRGDFVILDQFIDFTKHRKTTFYEEFKDSPKHTAMAKPFDGELRERVVEKCRELDINHLNYGTVITIEGPRFSTIAESKMFQSFGADVINMSTAPEVVLANEIGIPYVAIAMSTDYDCWKTDEEAVTWDAILETFEKNVSKVKRLLIEVIKTFSRDDRLDFIKSQIRTIPNFPKEGIMFRDITTLFGNPDGMKKVMEVLGERYRNKKIDVVCGIESRGFIVGGSLAEKLGCSFVPIRKKGKLPYNVISQDYQLEYGVDTIEIHTDAIKEGQVVLIIDDLIATGGTAKAACQLVEKVGGKIAECSFIIDLPELKGKEKLVNYPVYTMVEFEGE
jgi:5'-methylthioadenosine phosphorylase